MGVDNLNDANDPRLKEWRLAELVDRPGFEFIKMVPTWWDETRVLIDDFRDLLAFLTALVGILLILPLAPLALVGGLLNVAVLGLLVSRPFVRDLEAEEHRRRREGAGGTSRS